jgi:hypothetical protein
MQSTHYEPEIRLLRRRRLGPMPRSPGAVVARFSGGSRKALAPYAGARRDTSGKVLARDPQSLIAALGSSDPRERERGANGLITIVDPRAEEPLVGALADPEAGVRGQAAPALGSLGSRRAVPRLMS